MAEPKIGLALGSGGAKGFAHIGVLKVLNEVGIPISFMAGSSMGALACALYASGHDWKTMARMAKAFRRKHFMDWTIPKMGLISGQKVTHLIKALTHNRKFEECRIPIKIVATDILTGKHVIFEKGYLHTAIRASISIPGIFVPVKMGDKLLVDGGVIDRVPVKVVKDMGADITIAVDVASYYGRHHVHTIYDVIMSSIDIMQQQIVTLQEPSADILLKPPVGQNHIESNPWESMDKIIQLGEETTRENIPDIQQLIQAWKERS